MRIASFRRDGESSYGVVVGDGIVDAGPLLGPDLPTLGSVLRAGALPRLHDVTDGRPADVPLADVELLPVVTDPDKVLCAGVNYAAHRDEANHAQAEHPTIFIRFPDTHVAHGQPLCRPSVSPYFDYEGELAAVVGKGGFAIPEADAMDHVAGYACYNDASVRDWQMHTQQWTPGKNFPGTGAFGPWLVTADEVPDAAQLELTTRVNGEVRQNASVADLIFSIPALIAYVSTFTRLSPGDVLVTGTPSGVGAARKPPVWLGAGDVVEVEISGVGLLRNVVAVA